MAKRSSRAVTAAEHQEMLSRDPDYPLRLRENQNKLALTRARLDAEQEPILRDVRALGVHVPNLTALFSLKKKNTKVSEALSAHLLKEYQDATLDGLVRAIIAAGPCDGVFDRLLELLKHKKGELPKARDDIPSSWFVVGTTVHAILQFATRENIDTLALLLADEELKDYHKQIRTTIKKITAAR